MDQLRKTAIWPIRQRAHRTWCDSETAQKSVVGTGVRGIIASGVCIEIHALTKLQITAAFLYNANCTLAGNERARRRHPCTRRERGHVGRNQCGLHPHNRSARTQLKSFLRLDGERVRSVDDLYCPHLFTVALQEASSKSGASVASIAASASSEIGRSGRRTFPRPKPR